HAGRAAHAARRAGRRPQARIGARERVAATARRRPQRARHRPARHDRDPAGDQGRRRDPGRHRGDVMGTLSSIGPKPAFATATLPPSLATKLPAALASKLTPDLTAKLAPGLNAKLASGIAAKARATATDFEQVFLNSMFG